MSKPPKKPNAPARPNPKPSRTGADSVGNPASKAESVTYRGIQWQLTATGLLQWWNADAEAWVRHRPGADAPPRPPAWETAHAGGGGPATNKAARASWRSPYRLVPLGLFVVIIVFGAIQATSGSGGLASDEAKASSHLVGRCLRQNGTAGGHPRYSAKGLPCATPGVSVKVVRVLPGTPNSPACRAGETGLALPYPGVPYPHVECVVPVTGG